MDKDRNKYINTSKIEELRLKNNYSISFMNNFLNYKSRNTYRMKLKNDIEFNVEDIVMLSNLYNCPVESLLVRGGKI